MACLDIVKNTELLLLMPRVKPHHPACSLMLTELFWQAYILTLLLTSTHVLEDSEVPALDPGGLDNANTEYPGPTRTVSVEYISI